VTSKGGIPGPIFPADLVDSTAELCASHVVAPEVGERAIFSLRLWSRTCQTTTRRLQQQTETNVASDNFKPPSLPTTTASASRTTSATASASAAATTSRLQDGGTGVESSARCSSGVYVGLLCSSGHGVRSTASTTAGVLMVQGLGRQQVSGALPSTGRPGLEQFTSCSAST